MAKELQLDDNPLWYKDGIIYQVHIKAYRDSNGDGIGDFKGLVERLDYIESLGVTIIWVLPFYPSPLKDDGYDIADYFDIHSNYGKLEDFKEFLREAHSRGIRVITELVLNHTSDQHPWFKRARTSPPDSPYRNYYVWSDTPEKYKDARIIFGDFEASNWAWDPIAKAYYWHRFYYHQPDLNFDFPQVHKQLTRVVDYWLEMGVDGLRLDAVPYLYEREGTNCENLPETHEFLKKLNAHVKNKFKNKMLLAEANQWPEDAVQYFGKGDECHMAFHFPIMPRLYMAIQMEERFPIVDIIEQTPAIPENCQWAMFLRNHDELTLEMVTDEERDYMYRYYAKDSRARINLGIRRRLAPLVENDRRKIELLHILLFSFPGTPIVYYGDEIGMGDNYYLGDRDGVRTPMQWSPDRNAGFSETNPQRLYLPVIIDPEYNFETINVEVQERVSSSLLWWMKQAIRVRKNYQAFGRGTLEFLSPNNSKVLAFLRSYQDETILVVANLSKFSQVVELDLSKYTDRIPMEMFSMNKFPVIKENTPYILTLNPYDYYWFLIPKIITPFVEGGEQRKIPEINLADNHKAILDVSERNHLEEKVLLDYIKYSVRFMIGDKKYQDITLIDQIRIADSPVGGSLLVILRVTFADQLPEIYMLTLNTAIENEAENILNTKQPYVIAKLITNGKNIVLYEGIIDNKFDSDFLKSISMRKTLKGKKGYITVTVNHRFKKIMSNLGNSAPFQYINERENNVDILFNNIFYVRFYYKLEEGLNPGVEVLRFLSEKTSFINIQPYLGSLHYHNEKIPRLTIGLIRESINNEGTAYDIFLSSINQFFDNVVAKKKESISEPVSFSNIFDSNQANGSNLLCETEEKMNLERVTLLGKRTAELHKALMSSYEEPAFIPEQFSLFYQRSVYQAIRSTVRLTFRNLRRQINELPAKLQADYNDLILTEQIFIDYIGQLVNEKIVAKKFRIHGDYHLGNILFTGKDFVITNFEGPSLIPMSERRLKRSPLRDISSMIWSLYYAAFTALAKYTTVNNQNIEQLETYAEHWWLCMSNSFIKSYTAEVSNTGILPKGHELLQFMVRIYLIEKIMMELRYGLSIKSDWLNIPFRGLKLLSGDLETVKSKDKNGVI